MYQYFSLFPEGYSLAPSFITESAEYQNLFVDNEELSAALATKEDVFTVSAPLSKTSQVVSIPAATDSVDGYIKKEDWSNFNGKEANTASNYGSTGVGPYDSKNGVDLVLRRFYSTTPSTLSVTLDAPNKRINLAAVHGNQGGGSLHSLVDYSNAGFMSPTDKSKLDNMSDLWVAQRGEVRSNDSGNFEPIEELMIRTKQERYYKFVYFLRVTTDDNLYGCDFKFARDTRGQLSCHVGYNTRTTGTVFLPLIALDTEVHFATSAYNKDPMLMRVEGIFYCETDGTLLPMIRTNRSGVEFKVLTGSIVEWRDYVP
jgi:hypothetical protein